MCVPHSSALKSQVKGQQARLRWDPLSGGRFLAVSSHRGRSWGFWGSLWWGPSSHHRGSSLLTPLRDGAGFQPVICRGTQTSGHGHELPVLLCKGLSFFWYDRSGSRSTFFPHQAQSPVSVLTRDSEVTGNTGLRFISPDAWDSGSHQMDLLFLPCKPGQGGPRASTTRKEKSLICPTPCCSPKGWNYEVRDWIIEIDMDKMIIYEVFYLNFKMYFIKINNKCTYYKIQK